MVHDLMYEHQQRNVSVQEIEEKHRRKYNQLKQLLAQYKQQVAKFQDLTEANQKIIEQLQNQRQYAVRPQSQPLNPEIKLAEEDPYKELD